jgi:hypothetical protein
MRVSARQVQLTTEEDAERTELTTEAVELAPMVAPAQPGARSHRDPGFSPAWLIVLPPSRLRAFRHLELWRTPPSVLLRLPKSLPPSRRLLYTTLWVGNTMKLLE